MASKVGGGAWARLREPDDPYDGDDEEKTPQGPARVIEQCRPCRGGGVIRVIRGPGKLERGRRCPFCRGRGFRFIDPK